jgi:hypothetical protein
MLWTVARFPDGSWSTGGKPGAPDYRHCEVWQIEASSREDARKKAMAKRAAARRKGRKVDQVATAGATPLTRCAAGRDGECAHAQCPQLRDKEPATTGRHCPLDNHAGDDE